MRPLLTSLLDLFGLLLVVLAATLWVAQASVPLALAVAGAGLLGVSWLVDRAVPGRTRRKGTQ